MARNNIWGDILQSIAPNRNVRDYQHAARTFIDGLYRLSPKLNNLFHVFIDVNLLSLPRRTMLTIERQYNKKRLPMIQ
jgi:hypothetical protein